MSDTCPTCGKTPFSVRFVESDSEFVIGSCECAKQPEPTMAEVIAQLGACRAELGAIRAEQAAATARASASFALLQDGEAVLPSVWSSTITTLRPEWMRSTTSDRLAICRSVSS